MHQSTQPNNTQDDIAISVQGLSKAYRIWRDPSARLKAPIWETIGSIVPKALRPKALKNRLSHEGKSRYYTDFFALDHLNIEIKKGEAVGIIGRNGSGKSTLLQMIAGTLTPTTGEIQVNGRVAALLELGSGFDPDFTGRENIFLNGSLLGLSRTDIQSKMNSILEFADIGEFIDQPVKTYSSGMAVRLAFAVQVQVSPDILIVDEALSVGDAFFQHRCFRKIEELMSLGMTLLFVSHDSTTMRKVCQKCLLLDKGYPLIYSETQEVLNEYTEILDKHLFAEKKNINTTKARAKLKNESSDKIEAINSISNIDKRRGEGYAQIIGIAVFNQDGQPASIFETGSPFEVRMTIQANELVKIPLIGINLYDKIGNEIIATNTEYEKYEIEALEKGKKLTISFYLTPPPIAPGIYSIDAAVNDGTQSAHKLCDWIANCSVIEITSSTLFHGRFKCATKVSHC